MKIAVLGSGGGGTAVAFDWALAGHDLHMFDFEEFPANIKAINDTGGIHSEGQLEGFAKITYAGHDIEKVVVGADIVFVVGPAYSTKAFGDACRPFIKKGQTVVVCPGSCGGAIVFKNALGVELKNDDVIVAETHTLPYATRLVSPGNIKVYLKLVDGIYLAAHPYKYTIKVKAMVRQLYPAIIPAANILQTALQNANPVIHPAVTLLNTALIERTGGDFNFYEEGVTPAVGKLIKAVDEERIAVGKKLGLDIISDPELGVIQGYMQEASYDRGYIEARGFKGIKAQSQLDYRYFTEDAGYGLVFISDLGRFAGVSTPVIDSLIQIVSVLLEKNYMIEKPRSLKSLGLDGYTVNSIKDVL